MIRLRTQVAWACRILAMHGHADMTLGHVSVRGPGDIIYIKCKDFGLDEITPDNVIAIDLDGNKVSGEGDVHLESVLHTEVYRLRSDVHAIAHTHAPYATALGASQATLSLVNHDSLLFYEGLGCFDETAGLITNAHVGQAVAHALGDRKAVLMRNHGVLVVGKDVPWLTYTALTLERAIQIQMIAQNLGPLAPFPEETAARLSREKYRDDFTEGYWHYLIRKLRNAGLANGMPDETHD
ncbi:MAG: class II aldolase/adducin family protein [Anaerolineae bacterium]|nr:class II aldolase/adducin family protein [Anaerolineae bacterium]